MKRKNQRAATSARSQSAETSGLPATDAPLQAFLSLTTQCNLHCKGCYAVPERGEAQYMEYGLALAILDKLARLGFSSVWFGGGEPLLYPHLFELAEAARSLSLQPAMTTNAALLNDGMARRCRVFEEIHATLHTLEDLPVLESAIEALGNEGLVPVLDVLLTRKTYSQLADILAWARRLRLVRAQLVLFRVTPSNDRYQNLQLMPEQQRDLVSRALRLSAKHRIAVSLDCALSPLARACGLSARETERLGLSGCPGGLRTLAIDVLGRYKPCLFWPETFGSALDLSLDEWRHGASLAAFRQQAGRCECADCDYAHVCNQGCRLYSEQLCQLGD